MLTAGEGLLAKDFSFRLVDYPLCLDLAFSQCPMMRTLATLFKVAKGKL